MWGGMIHATSLLGTLLVADLLQSGLAQADSVLSTGTSNNYNKYRYGDSDYADYIEINEQKKLELDEVFNEYFRRYTAGAQAALESLQEQVALETEKNAATDLIVSQTTNEGLSGKQQELLEDALAQASLEDEKIAGVIEEYGADLMVEEQLKCNPAGSYNNSKCDIVYAPLEYELACPSEGPTSTEGVKMDCFYKENTDLRYQTARVMSGVERFKQYIEAQNFKQCDSCNHNLQVFLCAMSYIPCGGLSAQSVDSFRRVTEETFQYQNRTEEREAKEAAREEREEAIGNYIEQTVEDEEYNYEEQGQGEFMITLKSASIAFVCREVCEVVKDTCAFGDYGAGNMTLVEHQLNLNYFPEDLTDEVALTNNLYYQLSFTKPCEMLRFSYEPGFKGKCPMDSMIIPDGSKWDTDEREFRPSDCEWYFDDYPGLLAMMIVSKEVVDETINYIKAPMKITLFLIGLTHYTVEQIFFCADKLTQQTERHYNSIINKSAGLFSGVTWEILKHVVLALLVVLHFLV